MPSSQHTASIGMQRASQIASPDELQDPGPEVILVEVGVGDSTVWDGGGDS